MKTNSYKPIGGCQEEYVHLDVDGHYAQMAISGILSLNVATHLYFLCSQLEEEDGSFSGSVDLIDEIDERLRGISIHIKSLSETLIEISFGLAEGILVRQYRKQDKFLESVVMEFDRIVPHKPVLEFDTKHQFDLGTNSHELEQEKISIKKVFERVGFNIISAPNQETNINLDRPAENPDGFDDSWTRCELHAAMSRFWSGGAPDEQAWALWVLVAGKFEADRQKQRGLMFDLDDDSPRQGAVLFYDADLFNSCHHDAITIARNKFFYACHEIGHAFNLAHPHERDPYNPWAKKSDHEDLSYMHRTNDAVFDYEEFGYRFRNDELMFMRHAPRKLVKPGASPFKHKDAHAGEEKDLSHELRLNVVVNEKFEFLEPVMIELQLQNISDNELMIDQNILIEHHNIHISVENEQEEEEHYESLTHDSMEPDLINLKKNCMINAPVFLGYSRQGWIISTPGKYTIRAVVQTPYGMVKSMDRTIEVKPPTEDIDAQLYFTHDVGRALAFDGTLDSDVNGLLESFVKEFGHLKAALHYQVALAMPKKNFFKQLNPIYKKIELSQPNFHYAYERLHDTLITKSAISQITLGAIDYQFYKKELEALKERIGIHQK